MDPSAPQLTDINFSRSRRGYDPDEVDNFLEKLGDAVVKLQTKVEEANRRADEAERRAEEASERAPGGASEDEIGETLKKTLLLAQKTADETLAEAKKEAEKLLSAAKAEAERLLSEAQKKAEARAEAAAEEAKTQAEQAARPLRDEVSRLEGERDRLAEDVEQLERYLDLARERISEGISQIGELLQHPERFRAGKPPELLTTPKAAAPTSAPSRGAEQRRMPASAEGGGAEARPAGAEPTEASGSQPVASGRHDASPAGPSTTPPRPPMSSAAPMPAVSQEPNQARPAPARTAPATQGPDTQAPPAARSGTATGAAPQPLEIRPGKPQPDAAPSPQSEGTAPPPAPKAAREETADDGFLSDLKRAVSDDSPLGPVDPEADAAMRAFFEQDLEEPPRRPKFGRRR